MRGAASIFYMTLCGISPIRADALVFKDRTRLENVAVTPKLEKLLVRFCDGRIAEYNKNLHPEWKRSVVICAEPRGIGKERKAWRKLQPGSRK